MVNGERFMAGLGAHRSHRGRLFTVNPFTVHVVQAARPAAPPYIPR
jgi:hypothetical protein